MKPSEIQDLIKFVAKSGVSEVEIEDKEFKITIKTTPHIKGKQIVEAQPVMQMQAPVVAAPIAATVAAAPVASAPAPAAPAPTAEASSDDAKYIAIKSPMIKYQ